MSASSADPRAAESGHVIRQYGWLLASRLLSAGLQALTLVLLARGAGPATFGIVASVTGILLFLGILADFGLSGLLLREHSRDAPGGLSAAAILRLNLVTSALLTVGVVIGLAAYALVTDRPALLALLPLAGWIAAEKNGDAWLSLATASGRSHLVTWSILIRRGVALLMFLGLARIADITLAYAVAVAVGSVLANLVMRAYLRLPASVAEATRLGTVARAAWPFFLHSFATMIRTIDVAIVAAAAGPVAAGIYAVPSRLTTPLRMLPATLGPLIVRSAAIGTVVALRAIARVSAVVTGAMIAVLIVLAVVAEPLVDVVLGPSYAPAVLPLRVICVGLVFAFGVSLETNFLQGRGQERLVGRVGLAVAVLIVIGLALGARLAGPLGATVAASLSFVVQFLLLVAPTVRGVRLLRR